MNFLIYSIVTFFIFVGVLMRYPHQFDSTSPKWHIIGLGFLGGPIFWGFLVIMLVVNAFNKCIEKFDEHFK